MLAATNTMDPKRDGTLCSSIDRHTECYILCENFALEIIIVLRTDARKKIKYKRKVRICGGVSVSVANI